MKPIALARNWCRGVALVLPALLAAIELPASAQTGQAPTGQQQSGQQGKPVGPPPDEHTSLSDSTSSKNVMIDAKGQKITIVNFEDALIEGRARAPEGFVLQSRSPGAFQNIIELRRDFRPQILTSGSAALVVVPAAP